MYVYIYIYIWLCIQEEKAQLGIGNDDGEEEGEGGESMLSYEQVLALVRDLTGTVDDLLIEDMYMALDNVTDPRQAVRACLRGECVMRRVSVEVLFVESYACVSVCTVHVCLYVLFMCVCMYCSCVSVCTVHVCLYALFM
jgi:hypothetical protein